MSIKGSNKAAATGGGPDPNAIHDNQSSEISAITNKATPVDGDFFIIEDSAAGNAKKHTLWSQIKATLKTYFDTLYALASHTHVEADITDLAHTTDASDLTSGVLADARVQESNVTQHEAALSITESQITDLDHNDPNAIHDNVASEIVSIGAKSTAHIGDTFLIEDFEDSYNKKSKSWTALRGNIKDYTDTLYALISHTHAASDIDSGTFADARISESSVTQHESAIDHDQLTNFVQAEHATPKNSIELNSNQLQLVGDQSSPGNNKVYGTDGSGNKVWKNDPAGGGGGLTWNEVTGTSQTAAVNNGYLTNNASLVTVTLPTTAAVGKVVRIGGSGAGGWKVAQNSGETINFGIRATTTGTGGSLASTNRYDAVELICITANTNWAVLSSMGNITIV